MDFLHQDETVGSLVAKTPEYAAVFEKLGIDYCCKGYKTLKEICDEKKLNLSEVLATVKKTSTFSAPLNWDQMSLQEIINHIVDTYHTYAKEELPRISELLKKLYIKHSERYLYVAELQEVFETMKSELLKHMQEEESVVFPFILQLANTENYNQELAKNYLNSLNDDHLETGKALEKIRNLTNQYVPPSDACTTHKVIFNSLEHLEKNLHEHIHKENQILFPRVAKRLG